MFSTFNPMAHTLTAEKDTWMKRSPIDLRELPNNQRRRVFAGDRFGVKRFSRKPPHWMVELERNGTWYIDDNTASGEWNCSWETDTTEFDELGIGIQHKPELIIPQTVTMGTALHPGTLFSNRITPNITYGELALHQESRRFKWAYQCETAYEICSFIEKVRKAFGGKPVKVLSAYRPPNVNQTIGGAQYSEHLYRVKGVGAVDFTILGADIDDVEEYCDRHWPYSVGYSANKGFVHCGKRGQMKLRWESS